MMDAYAAGHAGQLPPLVFRQALPATEKGYKRGQMGLAYEIVINSNPASPT
jgi:spore cortex formation protein SpoVR/YcgB (stage V sporulation)